MATVVPNIDVTIVTPGPIVDLTPSLGVVTVASNIGVASVTPMTDLTPSVGVVPHLADATNMDTDRITNPGDKFLQLATFISYWRFDHKLNLLTTMNTSDENTKYRFERLLNLWDHWKFLKFASNILLLKPGDPSEVNGTVMLQRVFGKFISDILCDQNELSRKGISHSKVLDLQHPSLMAEKVKKYCRFAMALVHTDFLSQLDEKLKPFVSIEDYEWIQKLRRRLCTVKPGRWEKTTPNYLKNHCKY